uniref:Coiled-coil-helix-coiled-coil-helix domain containing 3 n=1 Tax=Dromaius novaehollandiae TaxID=8790 RepID=A0A8C4JXP9_DRONO
MGGGGSSTRRVTFEADENENITVVKGVRLSDSVIDRMKEPSSASGRPHSQHRSASGAVNDEELKKRIAEELALEQARRDSEAQKRRLKQEQMHVRDEFGKILERERIASNEHLTRAVLRERAATEEERQKAQRFWLFPLLSVLGIRDWVVKTTAEVIVPAAPLLACLDTLLGPLSPGLGSLGLYDMLDDLAKPACLLASGVARQKRPHSQRCSRHFGFVSAVLPTLLLPASMGTAQVGAQEAPSRAPSRRCRRN